MKSQASSLVPGETYFLLSYFDRELKLPEITTLVYVGRNLFPEDGGARQDNFYFQSGASFAKHGLVQVSKSSRLGDLTVVPAESLIMIYDSDALATELRARPSGTKQN